MVVRAVTHPGAYQSYLMVALSVLLWHCYSTTSYSPSRN